MHTAPVYQIRMPHMKGGVMAPQMNRLCAGDVPKGAKAMTKTPNSDKSRRSVNMGNA